MNEEIWNCISIIIILIAVIGIFLIYLFSHDRYPNQITKSLNDEEDNEVEEMDCIVSALEDEEF